MGASAGLLHPSSAIAWLVGVCLGRTLPAAMLWREANGEPRRLAAVALIQGAAAALVTLVALLATMPFLAHLPGVFSDAGVVTALVYTLSQGVVVLAWMAFDRVVLEWIATRVPDTEDVETDPGRNLEAVPELLRAELVEAVQRGNGAVRALARDVLSGGGITEFRASEERAGAQEMVHLVEEGSRRLAARPLTAELLNTPVELPSAARAGRRVCEGLLSFRTRHALSELPLGSPLVSRIRQVQLAALHLIESSDPYHRRFSPRELNGEQDGVRAQVRDVRTRLIGETARGALDGRALEELLERLELLEEIGRSAAESGRALARALGDAMRGATEPESRPAAGATALPADIEEPEAPLPVRPSRNARRQAPVPQAAPVQQRVPVAQAMQAPEPMPAPPTAPPQTFETGDIAQAWMDSHE